MTPYYDDGTCVIYHGDCLDVLPVMPAHSVDLLLTDPPYGINYRSNRGQLGGIIGDNGDLDVMAAITSALRVLRFNRHFYVFGPIDLTPVTTGATTELVWDKGKHSSGDLSLPWGASHERITFGTWHSAPSMAETGRLSARLRRGSVLSVPKNNNGNGATEHPNEKPPLLMRMLIEASSVIGETVLDPFMGSGSVLVAARLEGRHAIGVEIDERYCEIAANRLAQQVLAL